MGNALKKMFDKFFGLKQMRVRRAAAPCERQ
jgi:hypothetical protein